VCGAGRQRDRRRVLASLSLSLSTACASESDPRTQAQRRCQSPLLRRATWAESMAGGEESAMADGRTLPSAADTAISSPTRHFVNPGITLYSVQTSGVLARS
jgi:hypothetical protein